LEFTRGAIATGMTFDAIDHEGCDRCAAPSMVSEHERGK